ncbi:MAG TPA: hypothetical protein VKY19_00605 [Ktedonosporobacter sp.]|jgi:hypothetical protein|nr:hypothetical protein [Ktedonosporobacter sp.]
MTEHDRTKGYWNIFARELEKVLETHHLSMSQLASDIGIADEKVRRLTQSLHEPDSLPVLNTEEMRLIEEKLQLDYESMRSLRVGLLATSIQRMFMKHRERDDAALMAEQIFPLILQSLQQQTQGVSTRIKQGDDAPIADDEFDLFFDPLLQTIDDAEQELRLSYDADVRNERVARARSASIYFQQAATVLEKANNDLHARKLWQYCHDTSQSGLAAVSKRLRELGE